MLSPRVFIIMASIVSSSCRMGVVHAAERHASSSSSFLQRIRTAIVGDHQSNNSSISAGSGGYPSENSSRHADRKKALFMRFAQDLNETNATLNRLVSSISFDQQREGMDGTPGGLMYLNANLESSNADLERRNAILERQHADLEERHVNMEQRAAALYEANMQLEQQNDELWRADASQKSNLSKLVEQNLALRRKVSSLEETVASVEEVLDAIKAAGGSIEMRVPVAPSEAAHVPQARLPSPPKGQDTPPLVQPPLGQWPFAPATTQRQHSARDY